MIFIPRNTAYCSKFSFFVLSAPHHCPTFAPFYPGMFLGGFYSETLKNPSAWHSSLSQLTFECKLVPIKALICTLAHGCAFPWAVSELVPIPSSYVLTINGWFLGTTPQFLSLYVSLSFPKSHFTSILHMKTRILSTKVPTMLWVPLWVQSAFLRHHVLLCWGNLTLFHGIVFYTLTRPTTNHHNQFVQHHTTHNTPILINLVQII